METREEMDKPVRSQRRLIGTVFFIIGSLFSIGLNGLSVFGDVNAAGFWGDTYTALAYDRSQPTRANLFRLSCPVLLSPDEEGTIRAIFYNPHQQAAEILVAGIVSENDFRSYRERIDTLLIEPRGSQDFRWNISQADMVAGNFILNRVFLMNQDKPVPYPARTTACGVIVMDTLGLKGSTIVAFLTVASLVGLLLGNVFLYSYRKPGDRYSNQIVFGLSLFAVISVVCLVHNLLGWWVMGGLMLLFDVLLGGTIFSNVLFGNA